MRHLILAVVLCFGPLPGLAVPAISTLGLVSESGFNEVDIAIDVPGIGGASDTSTLSGLVGVRLEIDPMTDQVSEMTVLSGSVTGTGVSFEAGGFLANYRIAATSIGATLATPLPPGMVTPATGDFDASQHSFTVNSGTLSGSYYTLLTGTSAITADFATNPATGAGNGTGNVSLMLTGRTATTKTYEITVLIPVAIDDAFPATDTIDVAVVADGTVKATGSVTVPSTLYGIWAVEEAIADAGFAEDANGDGVPNGLQWALGLAADESPRPHLLQPAAAGGFEIVLPAGGCAGALTVVGSGDPGREAFAALDPAAVSAGNPIPAGTSGSVTVDPGPGAARYLRLEVSELE